MSSSRIEASAVCLPHLESLVELLSRLPDPRRRRGVRYQVGALVVVALTAVAGGARSFTAIGQWAATVGDEARKRCGIAAGRSPDEATFRRTFAQLDADVFDRLIGAWMWTRTRVAGGHRIIAIDGKTVRGARRAGPDGVKVPAPHLVAALDHARSVVVGQVATAVKSNEIPAARELLSCFEMADVVVTMDAMHTQHDTADLIVAGGGHYVFTVKDNTPRLRAALKRLPWSKVPAHTSREHGHGRHATRTIKVTCVPDWIDFPHAAQIAQLRRTTIRDGKKSVEVVYLITSARPDLADPATLAGWVQSHWRVENRLHWVRDVTFAEDASRVRTGNAPRIMASCRNLIISLHRLAGATNIAATLRDHAWNPQRALDLILTS